MKALGRRVDARIERFRVLDERITCVLQDRAAGRVTTGLRPSSPSATVLSLLEGNTGFLPALSGIYGVDLEARYGPVALIQRLETSLAFMVDPDYRHRAVAALCEQALGRSGLLLLRPGPGTWRSLDQAGRFRGAARDPALQLCQLFGALGFAQLCDDALGSPIPLLLQPWDADSGLLLPHALPAKSFSQTLRVQRLDRRRLILFDKAVCGPERDGT